MGVYAFYGPAAAEAAQQTRQSDAARRANELPALLQEIAETAIRLGPTGAGRCTSRFGLSQEAGSPTGCLLNACHICQQPLVKVMRLHDRRALQAAQAVAVVGQEYLISMQRGKPEQPQVVLRKLFNQLGTTFIKVRLPIDAGMRQRPVQKMDALTVHKLRCCSSDSSWRAVPLCSLQSTWQSSSKR